eukprot:4106273-Pyramimonas_sp.AAC.1
MPGLARDHRHVLAHWLNISRYAGVDQLNEAAGCRASSRNRIPRPCLALLSLPDAPAGSKCPWADLGARKLFGPKARTPLGLR